jgi:hypothetical protein
MEEYEPVRVKTRNRLRLTVESLKYYYEYDSIYDYTCKFLHMGR